jgi:hypothetical protein
MLPRFLLTLQTLLQLLSPLPLLMLLQLQHLVPRLQMRLSRPAKQILGLAAPRLAKTGMRTVGVIR